MSRRNASISTKDDATIRYLNADIVCDPWANFWKIVCADDCGHMIFRVAIGMDDVLEIVVVLLAGIETERK